MYASIRRLSWWCAIGLIAAACSAQSQEDPTARAVQTLRDMAHPLTRPADLDPLMERIGEARLVLLGEASHGTSEYYTWRAVISRRLIEEKGFRFIAVEGDWATIHRLNRYVKRLDSPYGSAKEIMQTFTRWPTWMWANEETRQLVEWLREYNKEFPLEERVGFYGMDVYGEQLSIETAIEQARAFDEALATELAEAYAFFDAYDGDIHNYARAIAEGADSCQEGVEQAYQRVRAAMDGYDGADRYEFFDVKQNAKVVKNAEKHARLMVARGPESWNARAGHFYNVVERLMAFYGEESRGVAWAHNTHIGDARATSMTNQGQHNIGQIARENLPSGDVVAVGFGTYRGTVQAGRQWGGPMETMTLPDGRANSVEDIMHRVGEERALFILDRTAHDLSPLDAVRGHRAVGVVYNPEREQFGNYVPTILPRRYDAFIFIDETRALQSIP